MKVTTRPYEPQRSAHRQPPARFRPIDPAPAYGLFVMGLLVVFLTGCGSAQRVATEAAETYLPGLIEQRLRAEEQAWHGTPYRYGGVSRDGIDCSGFVMTVYQDLFGMPLPRTTTGQVEAGEAVSADALQAGDLVFFRTSRKTRHVGIYLGDGEFAHASTSQGVTTSRLDNTYWRRTYWTSRRILPTLSAEAASASPSAVQKDPQASSRRSGW